MTDERPTPETNKFRTSLDGMREINQRDRLLIHARKLERERDEARERVKELIHENENLYRRLESVHEAREQRDHLLKQLEAERELADRLAALLQRNRDLYGGQQVDYQCGCSDCEYLRPIDEALAAWKESRGEV